MSRVTRHRSQGLVLAAVCAALLGGALVAEAEELKVGYVDLSAVFDEYDRTKSSEAGLDRQGRQKEAEFEGRMNELKKLREGLELLNDDAKDAKTREVEEKAESLQQFRNSTARDLRRDRDKVAKEILIDIRAAIQDYGKTNGFSLIIDARSLLYAQEVHDVTDEVLKLLNSRVKKPAAP